MKTLGAVIAVAAAATAAVAVAGLSSLGGTAGDEYDVIIRSGTIYDGSGGAPFVADVGIVHDTIAVIGDLSNDSATNEIDASGLAVSPGFINMLSWATTSLIEDGRSMSDIHQGVTLEVFGEGWSYGPLNDEMKQEMEAGQDYIKFDVDWTTLGEYLEFLEARGVSPNVASFVGATTVRIHEIGYEDRAPTDEELQRMKDLVRVAMEEGALGVGSSLIYAPAYYSSTEELIELSKVAAEYDGMYITHMRNEAGKVLEAFDEFYRIVKEAGIRGEIYHLKASGKPNWDKLDSLIERIESARAEGFEITADMYTYPASSTGLSITMPRWVQEGGFGAWRERLMDPEIRARVLREMRTPSDEWENPILSNGAGNILLVGFRKKEHQDMIGMTLAEVAESRGISPEDAAIDLVIEDSSRIESVFFVMSEDNVRKKVVQPWMAFDSDAGSYAPEGVFLNWSTHPRAYGSFARLLAKYVREEGLVPLEEAIRRLTSFPASNLRITGRGALKPGFFADVVIFDPDEIQDHATFEDPHQLATGVQHVFVNGVQVLKDGEHTGATPGRALRGPGYQPSE